MVRLCVFSLLNHLPSQNDIFLPLSYPQMRLASTHTLYTSLILVMIHAHEVHTLIQVRPLKILDLQMAVVIAEAYEQSLDTPSLFSCATLQIKRVQAIFLKGVLLSMHKRSPLDKDFNQSEIQFKVWHHCTLKSLWVLEIRNNHSAASSKLLVKRCHT